MCCCFALFKISGALLGHHFSDPAPHVTSLQLLYLMSFSYMHNILCMKNLQNITQCPKPKHGLKIISKGVEPVDFPVALYRSVHNYTSFILHQNTWHFMKVAVTQALLGWPLVVAVSLARIKAHDKKCSFRCKGKAEKLAHGVSLLFTHPLKRYSSAFKIVEF